MKWDKFAQNSWQKLVIGDECLFSNFRIGIASGQSGLLYINTNRPPVKERRLIEALKLEEHTLCRRELHNARSMI